LTGQYENGQTTSREPDPQPKDEVNQAQTESIGFEVRQTIPGPTSLSDETRSSSNLISAQHELAYFREIARLGAQIADALDYAHRQKVVHRDSKPSNLLLDAQGNVWVTDFGLAKLMEGEELSHSHDLVGTLRFMAPERFRGITDRRSDIYALGATRYEMLALRPVFHERDHVQLIEQISHVAPTSLRRHDPRIPRDLETIVHKVLAKDPNDRCDKASELRDELQRFLEGRPTRWRSVGPVEQFRRWCKRNTGLAGVSIMAAALTTVLTIGSTIAAWIYRDQRNLLEHEQYSRQANLTRALNAEKTAKERLAQTQAAETKARELLFESLDSEARAAGEPAHRAAVRHTRGLEASDGYRKRAESPARPARAAPPRSDRCPGPAGP
jgi:serine/threonine protein kinase